MTASGLKECFLNRKCTRLRMKAKSILFEAKKIIYRERYLFGSILFFALQRKFDMGEVLKYPLTPVPLGLCHVVGRMRKTPKVALMNYRENLCESRDPEFVDVIIVDGMFFLHILPDLPPTFGEVSKLILRRLCA